MAKMPNLPDFDEIFTVGLNRAVDLLAAKAAGGGGRRGTLAAIQTFEHTDGPITVRAGKYGPYVNQGKVNVMLPKDMKPETVTVEQALELIAACAAATGKSTKSKKPAAKQAAPKKTAKKPAAKKAAAKKVTAQA